MTLSGNSAVECHLDEPVPDTASELLAAELALSDIATVQATRKGKAHENAPRHDEDIAFDLQAASLRALIDRLHDHQYALSIDRAIGSDEGQPGRLGHLEQAEPDDHLVDVALGLDFPRQTVIFPQALVELMELVRPARESPPADRGDATNTADAEIEAVNAAVDNVHITTPAALETVPQRPSKNVDTNLECVICGDDITTSRSFKAPQCAHHYCRGCIVSLVEASLRDERLFPLRCCHQPLPLASGVFRFISTSLRTQFLAKSSEYSVPAGSRVYCSNPRCSTFLGASGDMKREITCSDCDTITCSQCKNSAHLGEDCSEHQSALQLRETAATNKWQTCPGCHAIVELNQGCYHITCRCLTQFCYLCSARWKTCDCRQWDEEQLVNDAERRVRNEFGDWAADEQPAVHAERVYRRMEALRDNHDCWAHSWRFRHGCGECEECGDFLPVFLMRCTNCQTLACRRCSVNRL